MKNQWTNLRLAALLFALPLVATAAASAQQWMADNSLIASGTQVAATSELNELASTRLHTISLNRAGVIEGRIASLTGENNSAEGLSELKVFFVRDGEIASEVKTESDGTFATEGLSEGVYSFVATGKTGFAAYGVRVVPFDGTKQVNVMEAAAVSPRFAAVRSILEKNLPVAVADQIVAASVNEHANKVVGSNRVRMTDGKLVGHVLPMFGESSVVEGTQVHIIDNDNQVAQVEVDDTGSFMVPDLEPGVYDFVAAGPSGFAAVSFKAVAQDDVGSIGESVLADTDEIPVAIPAQDGIISADIPFDSGFDAGYSDMGYSDSLDVCLTCQQDAGFIGDQVDYAGTEFYEGDYGYDTSPIEYAGDSVGCGCAAGGACGSCGDFSGVSSGCNTCGTGGRRGLFGRGAGGAGLLGFGGLGGGIGGLATLGGLAGGIVAIADDNNSTPVSASTSTTP